MKTKKIEKQRNEFSTSGIRKSLQMTYPSLVIWGGDSQRNKGFVNFRHNKHLRLSQSGFQIVEVQRGVKCEEADLIEQDRGSK